MGGAVELPELLARAAKANAHAEHWVGTVRRECLDWLLIRGEDHLEQVLAEFVTHYNAARPHRGLSLRPPASKRREAIAHWKSDAPRPARRTHSRVRAVGYVICGWDFCTRQPSPSSSAASTMRSPPLPAPRPLQADAGGPRLAQRPPAPPPGPDRRGRACDPDAAVAQHRRRFVCKTIPDTQTIIRTRPLEADVLAEVLAAAYAAHPERFVRKGPGAAVAAGGRVEQPADREEVMSAQ